MPTTRTRTTLTHDIRGKNKYNEAQGLEHQKPESQEHFLGLIYLAIYLPGFANSVTSID